MLSTPLGAISEIPDELIHGSWLQDIIEESRVLSVTLAEAYHELAEESGRKQKEQVRHVTFSKGDLVLVQKPFYEKGVGHILPQCDGPYVVDRVLDDHALQLADILTGEAVLRGASSSCGRRQESLPTVP